MYFPESKVFLFNKICSGTTLRRYQNSFDFRFRSSYGTYFFERTGSVIFANFHARSFVFVR